MNGEDEVFAAYHIPECDTHMNLRRCSSPDFVKQAPVTDLVLQPLPALTGALGMLMDPHSSKVGTLGTVSRITTTGMVVMLEKGHKDREFGPCDANAIVHCIFEKPMIT
jgi:hypothetical protein